MPYKDKTKNKWVAQVIRENFTRKKHFPTKNEAMLWEMEQRSLPIVEFLKETHTPSSLRNWAENYLDYVKTTFTQGVYEEKRMAFREFFKSINPDTEPSQLHPGMILKHMSGQTEKRSGNAANKDRKNMIAAWNWATKYMPKWPSKNPFSIVDRQHSEQFPRYIPPTEDFWKIYDLATGQDKILLLTYLHTAARRGELFSLKWNDVDLAGGRIRLWTNKRKKAREFDWLPMTDELHEVLSSWKEDRTFPDSEYVFLCEGNFNFCEEFHGKPFKIRRHWMSKLCEKAGVKSFGFHAIRHLSASILDDRGYPITVIQSLLRHKNANTTAKYLHTLRGMRVALDDAFKRENPPTTSTKVEGGLALRLVKLSENPLNEPSVDCLTR